ncbi:type I restriction enzyme HsdR N-terminal domain-containing protein [Flavobacteriaceae bacterium]|nr:type I restriction enzyme HsdR N-terminal domain-containing protein [Flavobacteriaceae bacterium]
MQKLNFPNYTFRIKSRENKLFIFDPIRKKEVHLAPEEWVRQHIISFLLESGYPASAMSIERQVKINGMAKRSDVLVYDKTGAPFLVVECKAPEIKIDQATFDQIARYNMQLDAPYLMLSNGLNHYFCTMNKENSSYEFLQNLPPYL